MNSFITTFHVVYYFAASFFSCKLQQYGGVFHVYSVWNDGNVK